ncbi:MAG: hypothetical protein Q7S74_06880 [Nanoarchaeota archaeon]|nr:hypothetical protein [Nanoarchaeota archaeon]
MIFGRNKDIKKCEGCSSKINEKYQFCPYCGNSFADPRKEQKDFGLLGRNDLTNIEDQYASPNLGITDKMIASLFNMVMKSLDKQLREQFKGIDKTFENAEVKTFPNGIRIKIENPLDTKNNGMRVSTISHSVKKSMNEEQIKKMGSFPRIKAKTSVKRIGDKVVYELTTPGVSSSDDIFVSKLESGYEVKAIGNKKIYVNSIPISLPLKRFSILKDKLQVEFKTQEGQ